MHKKIIKKQELMFHNKAPLNITKLNYAFKIDEFFEEEDDEIANEHEEKKYIQSKDESLKLKAVNTLLKKKKTKGRVKIKMEYIEDKTRRYTTFSKRKTGIMKKAYELSKLTGTQIMLLVASETGHVYTFATEKLQPMITSDAGISLIQTCLHSKPNLNDDQPMLMQNVNDSAISQLEQLTNAECIVINDCHQISEFSQNEVYKNKLEVKLDGNKEPQRIETSYSYENSKEDLEVKNFRRNTFSKNKTSKKLSISNFDSKNVNRFLKKHQDEMNGFQVLEQSAMNESNNLFNQMSQIKSDFLIINELKSNCNNVTNKTRLRTQFDY